MLDRNKKEDALKFLEFEEKNHLFDREVQGIKYWQLIRNEVYTYMKNSKYDLAVAHPDLNSSFIDTLKLSFSLLINVIKHRNNYKELKGKYVFSIGARQKEHIFSNLIDNLQGESCVISRPVKGKHWLDLNVTNTICSDNLDLYRAICIKMVQKFSTRQKHRCEEEVACWLPQLEEIFQCELLPNYIVERMIHSLITEKIVHKYYKKIFKKYPPKVIVQAVHYDAFHFSLTKVAHEYKIPVIEVQHGYISSEHIAYNYLSEHRQYFPDKVLLFGEFWKNEIRYPKKEYLVACGSIISDSKYQRYKEVKKEGYILFLSQAPYADMLYPLAIELHELLVSLSLESRYKIIYKLHPSESKTWNELHPTYNKEYIRIITDAKQDLYELFAKAEIQIGVDSTAIFEGLRFNLKTAVVYYDGLSKTMLNIADAGYAKLITSVEDFRDLICGDGYSELDYEVFWENGAVEKILSEIRKI